jgi:Transcriptional regulator
MSKWEPKEKRIEDVVNAAVEVFLEKGYEGASMEGIASKAGMSKGGLYHHFKNKEEILFYVNNKLCEPLSEFVKMAIEQPRADEAIKSYISNYITYWIGHQKELAFFFLTFTKGLASPDSYGIYEQYYNDVESFLSGLFEKGIQQGIFIEHNVSGNAIALLSALDGALVYLVMKCDSKSEEVIHHFEDRFVNSVMAKDNSVN